MSLGDLIKSGDLQGIRQLIQTDPSVLTQEGQPSPLLLSVYYRQPAVTAMLRNHIDHMTIHEAAAVGDLHRVQALLEEDPGLIDQYASDGFTPLGLATYFGHEQVARLLLERGAQVNLAATNAQQVAPLHSAVSAGHEVIIRLLLESGADPNIAQQGGITPLMQAAHGGHDWMVRLLLDHGARLNTEDENGMTALDHAAQHEQIRALLSRT